MKRHYFKTCLLTALLAVTTVVADAQKVITFESHDSKSSHNKSSKTGDGKNSLSVGLLSWFNGYVPVYYERSVLSMLSLQVGGGLTVRSFGSDLGYAVSGEGETSDNFNSYLLGRDVTDDYSHYKYRKTMPGLYASFAPKLYYNDEGMDGAYVSPMVEYKMFRYSANKVDETVLANSQSDDRLIPHTSETQAEFTRCIDLTINFGGHYQSRNHVVIGWSTGFGIRNATSERLDVGIITDAQNMDHYKNAVAAYSKTKFLFAFNFVIGGWF